MEVQGQHGNKLDMASNNFLGLSDCKDIEVSTTCTSDTVHHGKHEQHLHLTLPS